VDYAIRIWVIVDDLSVSDCVGVKAVEKAMEDIKVDGRRKEISKQQGSYPNQIDLQLQPSQLKRSQSDPLPMSSKEQHHQQQQQQQQQHQQQHESNENTEDFPSLPLSPQTIQRTTSSNVFGLAYSAAVTADQETIDALIEDITIRNRQIFDFIPISKVQTAYLILPLDV